MTAMHTINVICGMYGTVEAVNKSSIQHQWLAYQTLIILMILNSVLRTVKKAFIR